MSRYRKLLTAVLGGVAVVLVSAMTDNHISLVEALQMAVAGLLAFEVWQATNTPVWPYSKAVAAAGLAGLSLAIVYLSDTHGGLSLTGGEWVNVGIAVLTAAGVLAFRNGSGLVARSDPEVHL